MKLIEHNHTKTLVFLSGMFAGDWIWKESYPHIQNSRLLLIEEPLCRIGDNIQVLASNIAEKIKHIPTPIILISNSLGGLVSMQIARLLPEKIERIMISGSGGFGETNLNIRLSRHKADQIADFLMNQICFDKNTIKNDDVAKVADSFKYNLPNIVKLIKGSHETKATDILPYVKCPIDAIWGSNDIITPLKLAEPTLKQHKANIAIVNKCGHSPMYEQPLRFAHWVNQTINHSELITTAA